MEYWNIEIMERWVGWAITPALQLSIIPFFLVPRSKLTTKACKANLQYADHQHGKKHQ